MNTWFLLILLFFSFIGYRIFSKLCSEASLKNGSVVYSFYLLFVGTIGCIFFFCSNGLQVTATPKTLLFAFVYAFICITCSVYTLKAYQYAEVANVTVITSACGLITTSVIGALLFHETLDFLKILRILIMLAAVFFVFIDVKKFTHTEKAVKNTKSLGFLFIIFMIIIANSVSIIELKLFSEAQGVSDNNSFFFFTNVFILLTVSVWFIYNLIRNRKNTKYFLPKFNFRVVIPMSAESICANINTLVSSQLIAKMDVSLYTPTVSAIEIISGIVASFIFREKLGICSAIAMFLSIIAVII